MKKLSKIWEKLSNIKLIIPKLIEMLNNVFTYMKDVRKDILSKKKDKENRKFEKKIEDTVNNGDIEELINLKR